MTASKRNPFDVPRRIAEYIRRAQAEEDALYCWRAFLVERDGSRYAISFSYEEDYGYFVSDPYAEYGETWVSEVSECYRHDVVEYVGRREPVKVVSTRIM